MNRQKLLLLSKGMRNQLKAHILKFSEAGKKTGEALFAELAFCLFTPQSKAVSCWSAIETLQKQKLLMNAGSDKIAPVISAKGVRFKNNKARYLVEARGKVCSADTTQLSRLMGSFKTPLEARSWLVNNIKGLGLKEASHFLRNTGRGDDIAILDRHILKNLVKLGVIKTVPATLSKKVYFEIEEKMRSFSNQTKIPMNHLDLILWFNETGKIFK